MHARSHTLTHPQAIRTLWMALDERLCTCDELDMASTRLRFMTTIEWMTNREIPSAINPYHVCFCVGALLYIVGVLYCAILGWAGWEEMGWDGLGWAGWKEMGWAGLGWAGMGWDGIGWACVVNTMSIKCLTNVYKVFIKYK